MNVLGMRPGPGARINPANPLARGAQAIFAFLDGEGRKVPNLACPGEYGTLTSGVTWTNAKYGKTVTSTHDTDQHRVTLPERFRKMTGPGTWFALCEFDTAGYDSEYNIFFFSTDNTPGAYGDNVCFWFGWGNNVVRWMQRASGGSWQLIDTAKTLVTNQYYAMCATRDAYNMVTIYVDGVQIAQQDLGPAGDASTGTGIASVMGGINIRNFQGHMAFAGIWNRPMSSSEVRAMSTDPWAVFEERRRPVYFDSGGAATLPPLQTPIIAGIGSGKLLSGEPQ